MNKKLPLYKLVINDTEESGVDMVSFVNAPAIEEEFMVFEKDEPFTFAKDEKRRIVTGAMMIPNKPIYRNTDGEEFMVMFDEDTVEKIAQKFFKQSNSNNVNTNHETKVDGVYMFESFITDKHRGISPPKNYSKVANGSWFASYKIDNEEVWKSVEDGTFKGFSVEGMFNRVPMKMKKELTEIEKEINNLFKDLY
jgi:hypothetical protein